MNYDRSLLLVIYMDVCLLNLLGIFVIFFTAKKPYSRYISVAQLTNPITDILYHILGYYTGIVKKYDKSTCPDSRKDVSAGLVVNASRLVSWDCFSKFL